MDTKCFSQSTVVWLVGRRVENTLWELTSHSESIRQPDMTSSYTEEASMLARALAQYKIRSVFTWSAFLERFNQAYSADSNDIQILLADTAGLGEQGLVSLQAFRQIHPSVRIIAYLPASKSSAVPETHRLNFLRYITGGDSIHQWIGLFDALKREMPYYSTGWMGLLRQYGFMFEGDSCPIYHLSDENGQLSELSKTNFHGQKTGFFAD